MQDYASRLRSLPGVSTASQTLGPGSASALMGPYAGTLPGVGEGQGPGGNGSGMRLQLGANAPVDDGQRQIIDLMMSAFSNAPRMK
jgi:hypothetical protein